MEKIQHGINSLSLIFAGFFVLELMGLVFGFAMQPNGSFEPRDIFMSVLFFGMIPLSILLLQLSAKKRSVKLLWLGIGLFMFHVVSFILYGFMTSS